ncbi:MAG: polysulfide reductase NrfD [Planctomycetes bacterium]|nr:polysulfide reductase NrfD [Planctomycetota bacterium]
MESSTTVKRIKDVFWALAIAGLVVGLGRFMFGLGASTNMLDTLPWGLWKIFNMVAGAALATSGFVVACIIYILKIERFKPVAKLSIIVGFLGYGSSLFSLLFDIGLPHRGWHAFFMWNPHSFLFEVFWCVSCYWAITALELVPIISERFPFPKFTHLLHEYMLPFVVLGITLSSMHHSSLGSLFLASPTRLHPLWHTMWIPPEFFISAMGGGVAVIALLYLICSKLYGFKSNPIVLNALAKVSGSILSIYLVIKVIDLTVHHKWNYVFGADLTWEGRLFWVEILLQTVIPVVLFFNAKARRHTAALVTACSCAAVGLILHRINTGIVGYYRTSEAIYIPNTSEFILSFGILAAAGLVFFLLVERFYIFREPGEEGMEAKPRMFTWKEAVSLVRNPDAVRISFFSVLVIPLAVIGLRNEATGPFQAIPQPVQGPMALDEARTILSIDGNRNGDSVVFPHKKHIDEFGGEESCVKCHHLDWPHDHNTSCRVCHRDMEISTQFFDHEEHQIRHGGEDYCHTCHNPDLPQSRETAKACIECHRENMGGLEAHALKGFNHLAIGYKQAMHGKCLTCHRLKEKDPADPKDPSNCQWCHKLDTGPDHPE